MYKLRDLLITTVVTIAVASCGGGSGGGAPQSTNTYKVGGTVTGLRGTGLTLQNNGGDSLQIAADGRFSFATAVASGSPYAVFVQSQPTPAPGTMPQNCVVSSGAGTVGGADVTSVVVTCLNHAARFVYVVNTGSNTVSGYAINSDTGALTAMGGAPFAAGNSPGPLTVHPSGQYAYVSNTGDNTISEYRVDPTSGALTPVNGSPILVTPFDSAMTTLRPLTPVAIDPSGKLAIVANPNAPLVGGTQPNNLAVYRVDGASGMLTPVAGSPFTTNSVDPLNLTIDPAGKFVYTWDEFDRALGDHSTIASFAIDSNAETLTAAAGSPFQLPQFGGVFFARNAKFAYQSLSTIKSFILDGASGAVTAGGIMPFSPVIVSAEHPSGRFMYVTNGSVLGGYSIDSTTGAFAVINGTPITVSNSPTPTLHFMTVEPRGRFLYIIATEGIYAYAIDSSSGALTAVAGSPFAVAHSPDTLAGGLSVDPSGRFAYAQTNPSHAPGNLYASSIDPVTGALTPVPGSPFPAGIDPEAIVFVN